MIRSYTAETKVVETGVDNELKEKYRNLISYFENSLTQIYADIDLIKTFRDRTDDVQILFDYAPCFMSNAYYNTWDTTIVKLSRLIYDSDTNVEKFINFIEQNHKQLFTTEHYVALIPADEEFDEAIANWKLKERDNITEVITAARSTYENLKKDSTQLKALRDKVFAHRDKKMLNAENMKTAMMDFNVDALEALAKQIAEIVNGIYYYDCFTSIAFKPINSDDVLVLSNACKKYEENKPYIIKKYIQEMKNGN